MYKLVATKPFDRKYKKVTKRNKILQEKIIQTLEKLKNNPFDITLDTHKSNTRKYGERYSSSVTGDIRVIWDFDKETITLILLLDLGGHSGKNKVYN